ncbi:MAG: hypothetical protein AAF487_00030 [Bacteroidota bacterium]
MISTFSQAKNLETILIKGDFIVIDGGMENSTLQLRNEYGGVKDIKLKNNGKFAFEAIKDHNYVLTFMKKGYIKKEIMIDTHVEGDVQIKDVEFAVKLFPQASDSAKIVYNQPVGMIKFINGTEFVVEYNYAAAMLPTRVEI